MSTDTATLAALEAHKQSTRTYERGGLSYFPRLTAGRYTLSIQASDFNYSTPRDNSLVFLGDYKAVEVAIFDADDNWFSPADASPELAAILEEIDLDQVAGYVSWPDVERLYLALVGLGVGV